MRNNLIRAWPRSILAPPLSIGDQLDIVRYEESFGDFTAAAWHHAGEPQNFQSNWHIDCIADHLMAIARREIKGPVRLFSRCRRGTESHSAPMYFFQHGYGPKIPTRTASRMGYRCGQAH